MQIYFKRGIGKNYYFLLPLGKGNRMPCDWMPGHVLRVHLKPMGGKLEENIA